MTQQPSPDTSDDPRWDHLNDLLARMDAQVAESDGDYGVVSIPWGSQYGLFRDGRWMNATDALYEQVSPMEIVEDIGIDVFIEILERWLEDEGGTP
jgi:hypothetical protein